MPDFTVPDFSNLINSLNDKIAAGPPKVDFSGIERLADSYWAGKDQVAKNSLRDAFKDGIPTKADGSPDYGVMFQRLGAAGAPVDQLLPVASLDFQRRKLEFGQKDSQQNFPSDTSGTSTPPPLLPPSSAPAIPSNAPRAAPPGGANYRQGVSVSPDAGTNAAPGGAYRGPDAPDGTSIVSTLAKAGVPDEQAGPLIVSLSGRLKIDPNAPITDPGIQARVAQAAQTYVGRGVPQPSTNGQPPQTMQPASVGIRPPQGPQPSNGVPVPASAGTGSPMQNDPTLGGLVPRGRTPGQQIDMLTRSLSSGMLEPEQAKAYQSRLTAIQDALVKAGELPPEMKAYYADRKPGESVADYQARVAGAKAYSEDEAKRYGKKYDALNELGTRAATEIPQLELIQHQMETDPNFYSGFGAKYGLLWKQMVAGAAEAFPALGLNPNAAFSREAFGKVMSGNILNSLGQLKGMGQIRVAEINLAKEAAASQNYSIPANQVLVEISKRLHQRAAAISDLASSYNGGRLDSGFDKLVANYDRAVPLFDPSEVKNWRTIINTRQASAPGNGAGSPTRSDLEAEMRRRGLLK